MEFLKKLFAEGESLTWEQLQAKIEADKGLKLANLADGGYVAKDKYDAKVTELTGVQAQLNAATDEIKSYRDMDIDGIKQKAADWEQKHAADTKALQDQLAAQQREFAARTYLGGFRYANDLVRDAIYTKFMAKDFKMEGERFLGADDFMAEMQKQYPTGFLADEPPTEPPAPPVPPQPQQPKPFFAPQQPPAPPQKKRSLLEMMKYHNEHPDAPINFDT